MILYKLCCDQSHEFEGWFKNSDAYDQQQSKNMVACPLCDSLEVRKAPMAPSIATKVHTEKNPTPKEPQSPASDLNEDSAIKVANSQDILEKAIVELKQKIEASCEDVGNRFPEEARKIHYGEAKKRSIHGEASLKDLKELADEGVDVAPLPWISRHDA